MGNKIYWGKVNINNEAKKLVQDLIKILLSNIRNHPYRYYTERPLAKLLKKELSQLCRYNKYSIGGKRTPRHDWKSKHKPKKNEKKFWKIWDLAIYSESDNLTTNKNLKVHIGVEFKVRTDVDYETLARDCIDNEWEVSSYNPCADIAIVFTINLSRSWFNKKDLNDIKKIQREFRRDFNKKTYYVYLEIYKDKRKPKLIIDGKETNVKF